MLRNDYRRALVMLRAVEKGCSGHARLERRTLMGTLSFMASAPDASRQLFAALVGRRNDDYFAAALGELRRDSRGQYGLNASFDPRNVGGRELESYQLAVVVAVQGGRCSLVLAGNLNGTGEMDMGRVRVVACGLFGMEATTPAGDEGVDSDLADYVAGAEDGDSLAEDIAEQLDGEPSDFEFPEPPTAPAAPVAPAIPAAPAAPAAPAEEPECVFGIDITIPWPEEIEPLRALFRQSDAMIEGPGIQGYAFVRAPMPEGSGYPYIAIGIHVEGSAPAYVCYALPASYTPEPPPGLEDYEWLGETGDGWWIRCAEVGGA